MRNVLVLLACLASPALAQPNDSAKPDAAPPIQDNSFLVEEGYNQEAGVVQHISTFHRPRGTSDFNASFTQEWPVGSIRHQFSFDIPFVKASANTGIGDIGINYRYQLAGDGNARLAVAPRITMFLPTGDWKKSRGNGAAGFEVNLPVSYVLSRLIVTHVNAGAAVTPSARNSLGERASIGEWSVAQSLIFTASRAVQPMIEAVFARGQEVIGEDRTSWGNMTLIAPGIRGAFNFESGLQIVPGIAVPFGVDPGRGERGVFVYLSVEHGF